MVRGQVLRGNNSVRLYMKTNHQRDLMRFVGPDIDSLGQTDMFQRLPIAFVHNHLMYLMSEKLQLVYILNIASIRPNSIVEMNGTKWNEFFKCSQKIKIQNNDSPPSQMDYLLMLKQSKQSKSSKFRRNSNSKYVGYLTLAVFHVFVFITLFIIVIWINQKDTHHSKKSKKLRTSIKEKDPKVRFLSLQPPSSYSSLRVSET